jgi:two-component system, OmpR family, copper resistance phosphate regulon response regulator CusR
MVESMAVKILVVEDEPRTARLLTRELRRSGFEVEAVMTAAEAVEQAGDPEIGLVILDLDVANDDGWTALRRLSAQDAGVPVVLLAEREALERDDGLDRCAADVVTKPLHREELLTRVRVRLARTRRSAHRVLRSGGIHLELESRTATVRGRTVRLSGREFELLRALMRDPGRVISRQELLAEVWGIDFPARTNVVGVYVAYLRRKLGRTSIQTVRGKGYRMPG